MATTDGATGTHSSNTSSDNPHHLNTNIESGTFDEKAPAHDDHPPTKEAPEDEEDEDMDALIDELESQDGHAEDEEEGETVSPGTGRVVPEDQLQTDTRIGLTEAEVHARRKKYGLNQMKEEKENLILKFLGYFIGPIQFVMEVCFPMPISSLSILVLPSFASSARMFLPCFGEPARSHLGYLDCEAQERENLCGTC
jgi:H+-transporting ATPase